MQLRIFLSCLVFSLSALAADVVQVGAGSYLRGLPVGVKGPDAKPRRADLMKGPAPTNDWCSAILWSDKNFAQFPHPLAVKPEAGGLRVALPKVRGTPNDIFGMLPGEGEDLVIGMSGVDDFPAPLMESASDWFITVLFQSKVSQLRVSYGHGSPFVFAKVQGGRPSLRFKNVPKVWAGDGKSSVLGITVNGAHYGVFAPTGAHWQGVDSPRWECSTEARYFSVAALPDDKPETLNLFSKRAHNHVVNTQVRWEFKPDTSEVLTEYQFSTEAMEGTGSGTIFALYPHQWRNTVTPLLPLQYASVRGAMKMGEGESFRTKMLFPGILPALPDSGLIPHDKLAESVATDTAKDLGDPRDTYWEGKQLGRLATLIGIADSAGLGDVAARLHATLAKRLETWFTAQPEKAKGVFAYEPAWGTLIGYPASFGSDDQLNDHHFHYGYFIRAAAEIARREPKWASDSQWGGMVKLLIRDIASPDRKDPMFPFMRTFDPYAGHTWASGHSRFADGNNNESSSEALNAWSGVVLFGQAVGDRELRDLGAWLFTTELNAIEENWFNVHGDNFPPQYKHPVVTMVWGGKGVHGTWFSGNPEAIYGINWLPITAASLYLGRYPEHVEASYKALMAENLADDAKKATKAGKPAPTGDGSAWDSWPDLMRMYRALANPDDALAQESDAEKAGKLDIEAGNSRTNLTFWLNSLKSFGHVQRAVSANTPCYAVFDKGDQRTYAAWNLGKTPLEVKFSDGGALTVPPGKPATSKRALK